MTYLWFWGTYCQTHTEQTVLCSLNLEIINNQIWQIHIKMGNMQCPAEDAALLASVARDICPFPNYNSSPHFVKMLSINSSLHLKDHYTAVQSSLTPKQLEDFTQSLRTTFGREGKVTYGGVG